MIRTSPFYLTFLVSALLFGVALPAQDLQPIFDGKSLDGWVKRGGNADYRIEDAAIVGTSRPNTPNTFLCSEKMYSDFVLELEYKVHPELNSGIQIRSNSLPDYKEGRVHGYQVEIDPSDRSYSSGIYDEARRGWLFDLKQNTAARYAFRQNEWNHVRIVAKGDRIVTHLNGVLAANLTDDKTAKGFIGLQVHGVGGRKDPLDVRWRNIRLSEDVADVKLPGEAPSSRQTYSGRICDENAEIKKLADGFKFTEGPALGPDGRVYFSDIPNNRINVFDPATQELSSYREESGGSNGLMWSPNDALVSCEGKNRRVSHHYIGGDFQTLADKFEGKRLNSPNDLTLDNVGGIYFTDPRYGNRDDMEMEVEGVYYIGRNRKLTRVIDDMVRPNGLILSNDFKTLYVADLGEGKTYQYAVKKPGELGPKTPFAPIGSDGMTIDDFGNVYLTLDAHVYVFNPEGQEIEKIKFPENPANVTFGGADRNMLYVTARKGLYGVKTNVTGGQARANPK